MPARLRETAEPFGAPHARLVPSRLLTTEPEELLADLAHLDLFGALGDPVPTVVAVDVLEGHVAAVPDATARLHCPVGGVAGEAVGAVVAHRHEVGDLHVVATVE